MKTPFSKGLKGLPFQAPFKTNAMWHTVIEEYEEKAPLQNVWKDLKGLPFQTNAMCTHSDRGIGGESSFVVPLQLQSVPPPITDPVVLLCDSDCLWTRHEVILILLWEFCYWQGKMWHRVTKSYIGGGEGGGESSRSSKSLQILSCRQSADAAAAAADDDAAAGLVMLLILTQTPLPPLTFILQ